MPYPVHFITGAGEEVRPVIDPYIDPASYFGRNPPAQISFVLIASGGIGIGGGGGGGGVLKVDDMNTNFIAINGARQLRNIILVRVGSRCVAGTSIGVQGENCYLATFKSDNSGQDQLYTAVGGGAGNYLGSTGAYLPGYPGGSGGGGGGIRVNAESEGGSGTSGQGRSGGAGSRVAVALNSNALYYIYKSGSGGGFSSAGVQGTNYFLQFSPATGGEGISLAALGLPSGMVTLVRGSGTELPGYGSGHVASGGGGLCYAPGGGSRVPTYYSGGTGGTGAGSARSNELSATGFGCGSAFDARSPTVFGNSGGGFAWIHYAGTPAALNYYYDLATNRTYHAFIHPLTDNSYSEMIAVF